jgi:7-cyano-7-deazaguanine synthase
MKKCLVVLSGGLDSTVALYHAVATYGKENVMAVTFNYNSKHNVEEFKRAKKSTKKLGVPHELVKIKEVSKYLKSNLLQGGGDIPEGHYAESNMKKTVVPFRNGIMLAIAAGIAESNDCQVLMLGNHAGDHAIYPDCRADFIEAMGAAVRYGTYNSIEIESPFCEMSKTDIVKVGKKLKVSFRNTYSCYNGKPVHDGICSTCFERRQAFKEAKVKDPTKYSDPRPFDEIEKEYEARYQAELAAK